MEKLNEAKTVKNGKEAAIVGNAVLCVGDSCTTHWEGNGEMRVISFHWDYDQPIRVIRLRDTAVFYFQPSDLIAYTKPPVSGSFLFDKALLENATINQPEYVMCDHTVDKDTFSYCFCRKVAGVVEILLCKTMHDKNEFKQEVENLTKYFNAAIFRIGE